MTLLRRRTDFWGDGPAWREVVQHSLHALTANAPEDEVQPHTHEEAHFVLALSNGYMSSAVGAPSVSCTPLLIYNPAGTEHQDRFYRGQGRFLAISGGLSRVDGRARRVLDPLALRIARLLAEQLYTAPVMVLEGWVLQLRAAVEPAASDQKVQEVAPPWLRSAVEMIFTSDDAGLNATAVATECGVHPVHLARVFRRHLGCSPGEVLRGCRLERATAIIGRSCASLADAAVQCGFVDQSHLSNRFRAAYGATPSSWRRRGG